MSKKVLYALACVALAATVALAAEEKAKPSYVKVENATIEFCGG